VHSGAFLITPAHSGTQQTLPSRNVEGIRHERNNKNFGSCGRRAVDIEHSFCPTRCPGRKPAGQIVQVALFPWSLLSRRRQWRSGRGWAAGFRIVMTCAHASSTVGKVRPGTIVPAVFICSSTPLAASANTTGSPAAAQSVATLSSASTHMRIMKYDR